MTLSLTHCVNRRCGSSVSNGAVHRKEDQSYLSGAVPVQKTLLEVQQWTYAASVGQQCPATEGPGKVNPGGVTSALSVCHAP